MRVRDGRAEQATVTPGLRDDALDAAQSMRINRSFIVRLSLMGTLVRSPAGDLEAQLKTGSRLSVGQSRRDACSGGFGGTAGEWLASALAWRRVFATVSGGSGTQPEFSPAFIGPQSAVRSTLRQIPSKINLRIPLSISTCCFPCICVSARIGPLKSAWKTLMGMSRISPSRMAAA